MKKLIEKALPLNVLSKSAISDTVKAGHPGNIHTWWDRSPINSSAALLYSSLVEEDNGIIEKVATGNTELAKQILQGKDYPVIVDCFSGFGGLTNAAQKMGLKIFSSDINTLAVVLTKAIAEIPGRFGSVNSVHKGGQLGIKTGTQAIAEDVCFYGEELLKLATTKLGDLYSLIDGNNPLSFIWSRTVECPNPLCKCETPLASSFVLNKTSNNEYWAEPVSLNGKLKFNVHKGICPKDKESNKISNNGAVFRCPFCGETITEEYIKSEGNKGSLGQSLMAVCIEQNGSKKFVSPVDCSLINNNLKEPVDLPKGSISENSRWFSPPLYGYKEYADLFTERQLVMLSTFCDLIGELQNRIESDALDAGMHSDKVGLNEGGIGAKAYSEAIGVYLALIISRMSVSHSSMCSLDNRTGIGRSTFTRQAISMTWTFVENNPFGKGTGNYMNALKSVVQSINNLPGVSPSEVTQANALTQDYPEGFILFTELPYYDKVGYADLSDFFYIWLRKCLQNTYPELFEKILSSKNEISSIPEHYNNNTIDAINAYETDIDTFINSIKDKVSDNYLSVIFFGINTQDILSVSGKDVFENNTHFESIIDAFIKAGLAIKATWPIRTEKSTDKFDLTRIAIVFKRSNEKSAPITRRSFIADIKRKLPELLDNIIDSKTEKDDYLISSLGLGLSIMTDYAKIVNADGSDLLAKDALQLIYQETNTYYESKGIIKEAISYD